MIAEYLRLNIPLKDKEFDVIYPAELKKMSMRHFTEVEVAIKAAQLLVTRPKQRILDIGSGAGKFCFVAGSYSDAFYTGVEFRKHLVDLCNKLKVKHRFQNVNFIHADIMDIDFTQFSSFYFFNSFQEQIDVTAKLDDTIELNEDNFKKYTDYLIKQFEKLPQGTRLVIYHGYNFQIPNSYRLVSSHFKGLLRCWEQTDNPIIKLL